MALHSSYGESHTGILVEWSRVKEMKQLEKEWANQVNSKSYKTNAEAYEAYKAFYNTELRSLFIYQQPERHKAFKMEEDITEKLSARMEERMDAQINNFNKQASAFHSAMQSKATDISDAISTGTPGLTGSKHTALEIKVDENNTKLDAKLDRLMAQLQLNNRCNNDNRYSNKNNNDNPYNGDNNRSTRPQGTWRCLNPYCWTRGVCQHNSKDCKIP